MPSDNATSPDLSSVEGHELVMLRFADLSEVVGLLTNGLTVKPNDDFVPREPGYGSTGLTGGNIDISQFLEHNRKRAAWPVN